MSDFTVEQLESIQNLHLRWWRSQEGGERANLRGANLIGANLSDANLIDANLSDANLSDANLRGANLIGANLSDANLRGANLRGANLIGANLSDANLRGANLIDANLSDANLIGANLRGANLSDANLRGANLSDANREQLQIPVVEKLHVRTLEAIEAGGVLDMSHWHACETTHCRAGWAINLAGEPGRKLEEQFGSSFAGALICVASCPELNGKVPNFLDTNENALNDIKRLAALEASRP